VKKPVSFFTLHPNRWYGMQLWTEGPVVGGTTFSPIRIYKVRPLKSGNNELQVDFFHAFYPEGVRDKSYRLRILYRGTNYLLAQCPETEGRCVWLGHLTKDWLKPHVYAEHARAIETAPDLEIYLNRLFAEIAGDLKK